jgi:hypothetical protein
MTLESSGVRCEMPVTEPAGLRLPIIPSKRFTVMTMRIPAILLAAAAGLLLFAGAASAETPPRCYLTDASGNCLDQEAPETGTYDPDDANTGPGGSGEDPGAPVELPVVSGPHSSVRLTQATYVSAYGVCRYINNQDTQGMALFIGLNSAAEWSSPETGFVAHAPGGVDMDFCCLPAAVTACGHSFDLRGPDAMGFARTTSPRNTVHAGYNYSATFACQPATAGADPRNSVMASSWKLVSSSGTCTEPPPAMHQCPGGGMVPVGQECDHSDRDNHGS